jgi:phosphoribosylformylglycinamidine cyclo-ligase
VSEALKTFNCGIGMIAICSSDDLIDVISALKNSDCSPIIIGEIKNGTGVSYTGKL